MSKSRSIILQNDLNTVYQHAYKQGYSAMTAFTKMMDDWMKEMDKKKVTGTTLLDLVWKHLLLHMSEVCSSPIVCFRLAIFLCFGADFPKALKTECRDSDDLCAGWWRLTPD